MHQNNSLRVKLRNKNGAETLYRMRQFCETKMNAYQHHLLNSFKVVIKSLELCLRSMEEFKKIAASSSKE